MSLVRIQAGEFIKLVILGYLLGAGLCVSRHVNYMKIMVKTNEKEKWQPIDEKGYVDEKELQEMLADSPGLIPVEELGGGRKSIKIAVREAGLPGSGHTDLIGIDEDGNITIVETKLADNQEIKRKVIGQILEYAAYLWQKSYEEFDEIIHRKLNEYLLDRMQKEIKENDEWSAEEFRDAVEANLQNGTFTLFIVVDSINEELSRTIDYLRSKNKNFSDFSLCALELKHFRERGVSVVLPKVYGVATRTSRGNLVKKQWDETSFLADTREKVENESTLLNLLDLYNFANNNINRADFPEGAVPGAQFKISYPNAQDGYLPLFRLKNGKIKFGFFNKQISNEKEMKNLSQTYTRHLSGLPVVKNFYEGICEEIYNDKRDAGNFHGKNFNISEVFPDKNSLELFKSALLDFKKELQGDI